MYNTTVSHIIGGVGQSAIPHTMHTYHIWADDTPHPVFKPYFHSFHSHISKSNSSLTADTWPCSVCTKHTVNHKKNRRGLRKDEAQLQLEFMHTDKRNAFKISDKKKHVHRDVPVKSREQWKDGIWMQLKELNFMWIGYKRLNTAK